MAYQWHAISHANDILWKKLQPTQNMEWELFPLVRVELGSGVTLPEVTGTDKSVLWAAAERASWHFQGISISGGKKKSHHVSWNILQQMKPAGQFLWCWGVWEGDSPLSKVSGSWVVCKSKLLQTQGFIWWCEFNEVLQSKIPPVLTLLLISYLWKHEQSRE